MNVHTTRRCFPLLLVLWGVGSAVAGFFVVSCSLAPYRFTETERIIATGSNIPTTEEYFGRSQPAPSRAPVSINETHAQPMATMTPSASGESSTKEAMTTTAPPPSGSAAIQETPSPQQIETYVSKEVFIADETKIPVSTVCALTTMADMLPTTATTTTPELSHEGVIERVPHLEVSSGPHFDLTVTVYADAQLERSDEMVERIRLSVPDYVSECNLKVWFDVSNNLTIRGATQSSITIVRGAAKSTEAIFTVIKNSDASSDEECSFTAYFSYNGRPAGKVERRARMSDIETLFLPSRSEAITIEPAARQPDVTITVLDLKKNGVELQCHFQSPLLDDYKEGLTEIWHLRQNTAELVPTFFSAFLTNSSYSDRYNCLIGGGKDLFKTLPKGCKEMFWKLKNTAARTLLIVSQEPFIPWELMIPTKRLRDGSVLTQKPLGVTYAIGRWVLDDDYYAPPVTINVRGSYVIAPIYVGAAALDAAHDEAKFVCDNFAGTKIVPADPLKIEETIKSKEQSLIHFACHGSTSGIRVGRQVLELQDGTFMDSMLLSQIEGLQPAFNKAKPFVFINACTAGQPILTLSGIGGLANSFIDLGASAVIAPLWNIDDKIAHEVAVSFYTQVKADPSRPLARIVQSIRATAYNDSILRGHDTFAAYCFYGDPNATISYTPNP